MSPMVTLLSELRDSSVARHAKDAVCHLRFVLVHRKREPSSLFPTLLVGLHSFLQQIWIKHDIPETILVLFSRYS